MEMKVVISGVGAAIPKTGFGVNFISGSYIGLRNSKKMSNILMGLADLISIGNKSGTVVVGHVATDWFFVDPVMHNWVTNTNGLIGKKAEIEVIGTLIVNGNVDLKFTVFDKNGNTNELISKVDIESSGIQAANTKVRGVLKQLK
jgi:hypothetical protein